MEDIIKKGDKIISVKMVLFDDSTINTWRSGILGYVSNWIVLISNLPNRFLMRGAYFSSGVS